MARIPVYNLKCLANRCTCIALPEDRDRKVITSLLMKKNRRVIAHFKSSAPSLRCSPHFNNFHVLRGGSLPNHTLLSMSIYEDSNACIERTNDVIGHGGRDSARELANFSTKHINIRKHFALIPSRDGHLRLTLAACPRIHADSSILGMLGSAS